MATPNLERVPREVCYRCFRPRAVCYCGSLKRVENQTRVLIVQHPRERFHPFGTARIVEQSLCNVQVVLDHNHLIRIHGEPLSLPADAGLLYPAPEARDLAELSPADRPGSLVVLDGTWHQAQTLHRDIEALRGLPKFRFSPEAPSRYRIRREPKSDYVSTIEAIVHALRLLEPELAGLDAMLDSFVKMIDLQIETQQGRMQNVRHKVRRARSPLRSLPEEFLTSSHDLVLVYGESIPGLLPEGVAPHRRARKNPREIIHWTARRLTSGETLELLVNPERMVPQTRLCPMELSQARIDSGVSRAQARANWRAFTRSGDVHVAWNQSTLDLLQTLGPSDSPRCLKEIYSQFMLRLDPAWNRSGSLSEIARREGVEMHPGEFEGRADRRMAQLEAMFCLIVERAAALSCAG